MADKTIQFEGKTHVFPADFSDDDISAALGQIPKAGTTAGQGRTGMRLKTPAGQRDPSLLDWFPHMGEHLEKPSIDTGAGVASDTARFLGMAASPAAVGPAIAAPAATATSIAVGLPVQQGIEFLGNLAGYPGVGAAVGDIAGLLSGGWAGKNDKGFRGAAAETYNAAKKISLSRPFSLPERLYDTVVAPFKGFNKATAPPPMPKPPKGPASTRTPAGPNRAERAAIAPFLDPYANPPVREPTSGPARGVSITPEPIRPVGVGAGNMPGEYPPDPNFRPTPPPPAAKPPKPVKPTKQEMELTRRELDPYQFPPTKDIGAPPVPGPLVSPPLESLPLGVGSGLPKEYPAPPKAPLPPYEPAPPDRRWSAPIPPVAGRPLMPGPQVVERVPTPSSSDFTGGEIPQVRVSAPPKLKAPGKTNAGAGPANPPAAEVIPAVTETGKAVDEIPPVQPKFNHPRYNDMVSKAEQITLQALSTDAVIIRALKAKGITREQFLDMPEDQVYTIGKEAVRAAHNKVLRPFGKAGPMSRPFDLRRQDMYNSPEWGDELSPPVRAEQRYNQDIPPVRPNPNQPVSTQGQAGTMGRIANSLTKSTSTRTGYDQEHTYEVPGVSSDDARLVLAKKGNLDQYYVTDAALPENLRGKGVGQAMYLRAISEHNIIEKPINPEFMAREGYSNRTDVPGPNDITADAYNAIQALIRKGLIRVEGGFYKITPDGARVLGTVSLVE